MIKKFWPLILAAIIIVLVFAGKSMGTINFVTPPLVEGPKLMFFVPLPNYAHDFPMAMAMGNGNFGLPVSLTVISTWFVMIIWILIWRFCTKDMEIMPTKKRQVFIESLYTALDSLVEQTLGAWKKKYTPFISTLIMFIFLSNILSFFPIPGLDFSNGSFSIGPLFRSPTADLNTTVGLALITTFTFLKIALKIGGPVGYFKGLLEPMPFMLPINLVGELAKPTNISIRLFGNMFAGSVILGLLYMAAPAIIPAPLHLYFDLFSGLVQSFVFTMLTMVYMSSSIGDAEYVEN